MGVLKVFEILLNKPDGVYYAGEIIQGNCIVDISEELSLREIRLKFDAAAFLRFAEGKRTYQNTEVYLNHALVLLGTASNPGIDTTKLPPGRHSFPFKFPLLSILPSSFEGVYGHIRYTIKGAVSRPWKFDFKTTRSFTVIHILNLNNNPRAAFTNTGSNMKNLCCWCCMSGPITATFRIGRRGYVPGETIQLYANITNQSNRRIDKSYVNLITVATYRFKERSKLGAKEVARVTEGPIERGQSFSWGTLSLLVPQIPPSQSYGSSICSIIEYKYVVQLNVDPSGPSFDLEIPLEVIIGTIPLLDPFQLTMLRLLSAPVLSAPLLAATNESGPDALSRPTLSSTTTTDLRTSCFGLPTPSSTTTTDLRMLCFGLPTPSSTTTTDLRTSCFGLPTPSSTTTTDLRTSCFGLPTPSSITATDVLTSWFGLPTPSSTTTTGLRTSCLGLPTASSTTTTGLRTSCFGLPTPSSTTTTGLRTSCFGLPTPSSTTTTGLRTSCFGLPTPSSTTTTGLRTSYFGLPTPSSTTTTVLSRSCFGLPTPSSTSITDLRTSCFGLPTPSSTSITDLRTSCFGLPTPSSTSITDLRTSCFDRPAPSPITTTDLQPISSTMSGHQNDAFNADDDHTMSESFA